MAQPPKNGARATPEKRPGTVQNVCFHALPDPHCGAVCNAVSHRFILHSPRREKESRTSQCDSLGQSVQLKIVPLTAVTSWTGI